MTPRIVLVTGVSRTLGGRLVHALAADPTIERVIGVDTSPPPRDSLSGLGRAEFVRADIRHPLIARVISSAKVDTVVHMNVTATPADSGGRTAMKELNVMGTMQLLAAVQRSTSVKRLVVKSSSAVYGASPRDPALFTEDMQPKAMPGGGFAKDAHEIEGYVRGFSRRRPDVGISLLRFSNFIGPRIDSILGPYFALPAVPTMLGFDARLQLLHEDDAINILRDVVMRQDDSAEGITNVAGDGVLLLSQAIRRAGRAAVPLPPGAAQIVGKFVRSFGAADFSPEQMRFLNFGRVMDTSRLRENLGISPAYTTAEAFDDFLRGRPVRPMPPMTWLSSALGARRQGAA